MSGLSFHPFFGLAEAASLALLIFAALIASSALLESCK